MQFTVTVLGGFIYAFYSSWRVSLLILAAVPLMAGSAAFMMAVTAKQTERKNKNYAETGGIVYSTLSAIRTVFSLNATDTVIEKFKQATKKSYDDSVSFLYLVGFGKGAVMASFLVSYVVLTLYGSYLLYNEVGSNGCDPSNTIGNNNDFHKNETCKTTGTEVVGALLGVSFGAIGIAQVSNSIEAFVGARAACHLVLEVIQRTVEADDSDATSNYDIEVASRSKSFNTMGLPKYVIDSSSDQGKKLNSLHGTIEFKNVTFAYPTCPNSLVLNGLSLTIEAGKMVALVGHSGSGKSTAISLIERFYDPTSGCILLDGNDIRDINVRWLRDHIGLVAQEPVLFGHSIKKNIAYGMEGATDQDIINAAKSSRAHDFIMHFPDGYDTLVGDKGEQLSGGQKQWIAIARILLRNPKVLLLDEVREE